MLFCKGYYYPRGAVSVDANSYKKKNYKQRQMLMSNMQHT